MKRAELTAMTVSELKALAGKKKIALPSDAKKADIISILMKGVPAAGKKKAAAAPRAKAKTTKAAVAGTGKARSIKAKPVAAKTAAQKAKPVAAKPPAPRKRPRRIGGPPAAAPSVSGQEWRLPPGAEEPLMAQERVEDAKYFTGQSVRPQPSLETLPAEYGQEQISLLARDPDTVFGYWEVPQERIERERSRLGKDSRLCIRIYDVTGVRFNGSNATSFIDQEVYERIGSWYFHLKRPAHSFCADLGLRTPDGRFHTITRSGVIATPRGDVSDVVDEEWMLAEQELLKLYGVPSGHPGGPSSLQAGEKRRMRHRLDVSSPGVSSWAVPASKKK